MEKTSAILLMMFSVLSLNAKGLISHQKQLCLQKFAENTDSSILFLQETNLSSESTLIKPQKFQFFLNPPVQPQSGVSIGLREDFYQEIQIISHHILIPGYLQALHIKTIIQDYHLINIYMPHVNQNALQVVTQMNNYMENIKEESVLILGGDWNTTLYEEDRRNCSEIRNLLVSEIKTSISQNHLSDVWRNFNPNKQEFTFKGLHNNHPMARLDRIYLRKRDLHLVTNTSIIPSFSDHSAVQLKIKSSLKKYKQPYWKLDTALLKSKHYVKIINNVISHFVDMPTEENSNINQIWDNLKYEVKLASQRYIKHLKEETAEHINTLQAQIKYINSKEEMSRRDEELLLHIEKQISKIYLEKATEALSNLESQTVKEANTQSKFFLRLAKQAKQSSTITQLLVNGEITEDINLIHQEVYENYKEIFSDQYTNPIDQSSKLYENLPTLSPTDKLSCEKPISKQEIYDSIQDAQPNRAPGYDGLPIEFYSFFWEKIKSIMEKLFQNFQQTNKLPQSMKKVIIAPIPKKGNRMTLGSWRPIALMNSDYKVLSRIFSKRISQVVTQLLESDQSYCVPGRTIHNNIHIIRNLIKDSNKTNSPLAILALDQASAFNKISHKYLSHLLQIYGFGPQLCQAVSALVQNCQGHIKIGSSLLRPFIFQTGVRQGDPIAGPLYILSIEPFLRLILKHEGITGYKIPRTQMKVKITAYADDIHFFITENSDFEKIPQAFHTYSQQSGAQLNQSKSLGLFCGSWKERRDKPLDCQWSADGLKALGVYLGNSKQYEDKNWTSLSAKVKGCLNNWTKYVQMTSYHGRKIICNQLAGSKLVHVLSVLTPPQSFILDIHKSMINFLWQKKHWLHPNNVFTPIQKGGLGLTHLGAKIFSLRLKLAASLLQNPDSQDIITQLHHYKMSFYEGVSPIHFFCQNKEEKLISNLDPFYQSLLLAWHSLDPKLDTNKFSLETIRKTPLYGSKIINEQQLKVIQEWKKHGYKSLGDFINQDGTWKTLQLTSSSLTDQRRMSLNLNQIKVYINKKTINQEERRKEEALIFKFAVPNQKKPSIFPTNKRTIYQTCLDTFLQKPAITGKSVWTNKKINWNSLCSYPTEKRDADISWRLLHNALVTPRKFHQWKIIQSPNCPWCHEDGNAMHMIFHCKQATQIWRYTATKIQVITETTELTLQQALSGFPPTTPAARLSNFLLTLTKSTIYKTYINLIKQESPPIPNYLTILRRRIQYRISLEEFYAKTNQNLNRFQGAFLINDALKNP
jgi:uncharacterized protein YcgL (UPF0745 family)